MTAAHDPPTPLGAGRMHVPPGHPYSPIPSTADIERALGFGEHIGARLPGIDLREAQQMRLLAAMQRWYDDLELPVSPGAGRFHLDNTWFTYADALGYAMLLRHRPPRRVVEVGSGFSSALALDIAQRFLTPEPAFTFIDPDPVRLLQLAHPGELAERLIAEPVQDVPVELFALLSSDDILFIDSSHVLKAGSDVQFLFDQVFPVLAPGVRIHIHDVFYPFEYPRSWLLSGTALNEAYFVRTLLQGGDRFEVLLFNTFLMRFHREWFERHMPLFLAGDYPTGGIWLQVSTPRGDIRDAG